MIAYFEMGSDVTVTERLADCLIEISETSLSEALQDKLARHLFDTLGALLAGLPLLLGGVGCLISAAIIPRLTRAVGSVALARRIVAVIGFAGASASIF
jgi:hypothetical protein